MDTPQSRVPPAPNRRLRRRGGFSLVEVIAATFVMLLAISSAILVMQSGFRSLDTARKTTLAAQIMQSEMERLRMLSWSRVQALIGTEPAQIDISTIFPQSTEAEKRILEEMKRTFTATRSATYLSGTDDELIGIGITVAWKGIDGVPHTRTSNTRYCKNGLYNYYYTLNKASS